MNRFELIVLHPFLLAAFPVLNLYFGNVIVVPFEDVVIPLTISLVGTSCVYYLTRLALRDSLKSGIITSLFVILFFSYGRVARIIPDPLASALFLGASWFLLLIVGVILLVRSRSKFNIATLFLNIISLALVVFSVLGILSWETMNSVMTSNREDDGSHLAFKPAPAGLPDIYYIIVDSYASETVLRDVYQFDNTAFVNYLKERGFFVASDSRANYSYSLASMASSLNLDYLATSDPMVLSEMLIDNKVARFLKNQGYECIYISAGYLNKGFDRHGRVVLPPKITFGVQMSDFAAGLLNTTALEPISILVGLDARNDMLWEFMAIKEMTPSQKPRLIIAHLPGVHVPFVFDRDGGYPARPVIVSASFTDYYRQGYLDQLIYLNSELVKVIDAIILKSSVKPVIILQADHGPGYNKRIGKPGAERSTSEVDERMGILNAYHLPDGGNKVLYDTVSPVNAFRIVFNKYFGTNYQLLSDVIHFSD